MMADGQWLHPSPFILQKNLRFIFICVTPYPYLYQHFICFRIDMMENKHKRMYKFENIYSKMWDSKMYIITKCTLGHTIWNLFSLVLKQNCTTKFTTLHKTAQVWKVQNLLHNKTYWKIKFPFWFGFVKQAKNKVYILNWVFKLIEERFH